MNRCTLAGARQRLADDRSPLDVPGIDAGLAKGELAGILRESRRSTAGMVRDVPTRPAKPRKKRR